MSKKNRQFESRILRQVTDRSFSASGGVTCVTICHNEISILERFLDHYRQIGVSRFIFVDDNSNDGTREFLAEQDDVVLFEPANGARFRDNVGNWRQELLDYFCPEQWVTLPDLDEFLYYKQMPRTLSDLAKQLEARGEEALLAVMIDMYSDRPLMAQEYSGARPLEEEYPYFDDQGFSPVGIRIVAQPASFVRRYPTPQICFMGGARERLFFQERPVSAFQRFLLSKFAHMRRPLNPGPLDRIQNKIVRAATKSIFSKTPLVLNKFAILKWRRGTEFSRAPHSINRSVKVSEGLAALLHFKFAKGISGLEYSRSRAQHAGDSIVYKHMTDQKEKLSDSPLFVGSRKFEGVASLDKVLR